MGHDADCAGPGVLCQCPTGQALERQLDEKRASRAEVSNNDWFSSGYVPPAQRLEPVTIGEPLWTLRKEGHVAEARVRAIHSIGLELRYEWNGDLRSSEVFKSWEALEQAATEKRRELEAKGWAAA